MIVVCPHCRKNGGTRPPFRDNREIKRPCSDCIARLGIVHVPYQAQETRVTRVVVNKIKFGMK